MRRTSVVLTTLATCGLAVGAGLAVGPATASASGPSVTVIASHLNNPRGLSAAGGQLYLAEAGRGGTTCGGGNCVGLTGSIDRVGTSGVTRLVTGLISLSGDGGVAAEGMVAVSASGGAVYGQFAANTFGIPASGFPTFLLQAAHKDLGQFGKVSNGSFVAKAGVGDHDYIWAAAHVNLVPDQFPDSNPNGVLVTGGQMFVADAGANTLDQVMPNGTVKVLTFLNVPSGSPTDAVPTCVAKGPDGALYVGELLGGNFAPGNARVWRIVVKNGQATKSVWARGLTTVQGCGFDPQGNFYATEFQVNGLDESPTANPAGAVVKIAPNGTRTTLGMGSLFFPSGFAFWNGAAYVSNCSIAPAAGLAPTLCATGGQVVAIR